MSEARFESVREGVYAFHDDGRQIEAVDGVLSVPLEEGWSLCVQAPLVPILQYPRSVPLQVPIDLAVEMVDNDVLVLR